MGARTARGGAPARRRAGARAPPTILQKVHGRAAMTIWHIAAMPTRAPTTTLDTAATWGKEHLAQVVAIDSASDESSDAIPSSEGQRRLSAHLRGFFEGLGFAAEQDAAANLLVRIPGNVAGAPALALMVHMDTARGTQAVPSLVEVPRWDGSRVRYPSTDRLNVDSDTYPHLAAFVGDDLLHGPGDFPIGLDDKVGMAELMTLARLLHAEPSLPHGELLLVFRPDEEIGRMEAVEGLASELATRGVRYGYTVDGLAPFEINVENFYAGRARVRLVGQPLPVLPGAVRITLEVRGVNTHGATAKAEGYRNATVILARAAPRLPPGAAPLDLRTDPLLECNAEVDLLLPNPGAEAAAVAAFEHEVQPLRRRGGDLRVAGPGAPPAPPPPPAGGGGGPPGAPPRGRGGAGGGGARRGAPPAEPTDVAVRLAKHLARFLDAPPVSPLLAEDSDGAQGYSSPHRVLADGAARLLDYRLRDFTLEGLAARRAHVERVAAEGGLACSYEDQYVNMGPALAKHPELVRWAEAALAPLGKPPLVQPIRGGTGVDPFLARGIPVANLGTGYFAPESEKELTTRQNVARHALWLAHLVQVVAGA